MLSFVQKPKSQCFWLVAENFYLRKKFKKGQMRKRLTSIKTEYSWNFALFAHWNWKNIFSAVVLIPKLISEILALVFTVGKILDFFFEFFEEFFAELNKTVRVPWTWSQRTSPNGRRRHPHTSEAAVVYSFSIKHRSIISIVIIFRSWQFSWLFISCLQFFRENS